MADGPRGAGRPVAPLLSAESSSVNTETTTRPPAGAGGRDHPAVGEPIHPEGTGVPHDLCQGPEVSRAGAADEPDVSSLSLSSPSPGPADAGQQQRQQAGQTDATAGAGTAKQRGGQGQADAISDAENNRKLPASFDSSRCRSLYVGNLHPFINESILQDVFSSAGQVTEVKIIKDKQTGLSAGYGFVKLADHSHADMAMTHLSNALIYGQEIRVNWAFQSNHRDDTSGAAHIFVGDLSNEVTDQVLFEAFSNVSPCKDARVMWDHNTGRSKGYGFVSYRTTEEAKQGLQAMTGALLGGRQIRCGWAQHKQDAPGQLDMFSVDRMDPTNTNIYVGNLSPELSDQEIQRAFSAHGQIAEVKQHRKGGYGFVRYQKHEDAVRAIVVMNGKVLAGKAIKCSWGRNASGSGQHAMSAMGMGMGMTGGMPGGNVLMAPNTMQHMGSMPIVGGQALLGPSLVGPQQMMMGPGPSGGHMSPNMQAALMGGAHQGQMQPPHMAMPGQRQMLLPQTGVALANQHMLLGGHQQGNNLLGSGDHGNMYYGVYYGK